MEQTIHLSKLRSVEIKEVVWPNEISHEDARAIEWNSFLAKTKELTPPKGTDRVFIRKYDFPDEGKCIKGLFYHERNDDVDEGTWTLLLDANKVGVWLKSNSVIVEKENVSHKVVRNFETIVKSYQQLDLNSLAGPQPDNRFYLQHGVVNLPCFVDEQTIARFERHDPDLSLLIEMEMDIRHEIETMGLIKKTHGLLAAALVTPGGSVSEVRLRKREVAGMHGEEAVLKVREGNDTDLVFTWEYNGKDDSGEYPTTRINMESPDGNLNAKLKIWDDILDSMKPMFVRKN